MESPAVRTADESPADGSGPAGEPRTTNLYRVVWRWHFYAGLIVAPVMLVAAITGALYTFQVELAPWLYRDVSVVTPTGERLTYDEQFARLREQAPDFTELDGIAVFNDPTRSTEFIGHALAGGHENPDQMHRQYFVDPYSGKLLGSRLREEEFFHIVLDLHRTLLGGTFGRVLVELATSWGIVLALTGIYLWWPRRRDKVTGVWIPRLKGRLYVVLRDLHAVAGFYTAGFAVIVLFTGLFVSVVWGSAFTWVSVQAEQSLFGFFAHVDSPPASPSQPQGSWESVISNALRASRPGDNLYFQLAEKPEHAHKIYLMEKADTNTVRSLDIDQYTGAIVRSTATEELTPMVRGLALMVSLHQGKTFGIASKIVAFVTCLALVGLTLTGVWMWWERRPRGTAGFPSRPQPRSLPGWGWAVAVLVGVLLPTVGASAVVFGLGDWIVQRFGRRGGPAEG